MPKMTLMSVNELKLFSFMLTDWLIFLMFFVELIIIYFCCPFPGSLMRWRSSTVVRWSWCPTYPLVCLARPRSVPADHAQCPAPYQWPRPMLRDHCLLVSGRSISRAVNSLWPRDTIQWHRSRSTLAQVMAWCLMAPSQCLNQCWTYQWGPVTITWGQFHKRYLSHQF